MMNIPWRAGSKSRHRYASVSVPACSVEAKRRSRKRLLDLDYLEGRWGASTWSGVVDGLWSNAGNWDVPPIAGSELLFPFDGANRSNTNDLSAGLSFSSLTIAGNSYAISGNAIALTGPIVASYDSGTSQVTLPIEVGNSASVSVANPNASLELGGEISGSGGLVKSEAGTLSLTGNNSYLGSTLAGDGTLLVNGTQTSSAVFVITGATVGGTGSVGSITSTGGTVKPGTSTPGLLTVAGGLTLDGNSTFTVVLNGLSAGTEYSQVQVTGPVDLGGATLEVSLGFQPTGQPSFVAIDNMGNAAIAGTFAGLPEGASFSVSSQSFKISYVGGDGNDVVLTRLLGTTISVDASPTSSVFGQDVSLSAFVVPDEATGVEPTGSVAYFAGALPLGTAPLVGGMATLNTDALPVGDNSVTAQYLGDGNFGASTSDAVTLPVAQAATTTMLSADPTSSVFGQNIALTAAVMLVSPGNGVPTGSVEFFDGLSSLGIVALDNGEATLNTSSLPLGDNSVTAQYLGDADFTVSTSDAVTVTVAQAATTTSLNANPNPAAEGEIVALTAAVAATSPGSGVPTGSVEFFNGADSLGTAELIAGVATLETPNLPLAANVITAGYQGDENYEPSVSDPLIVNVRLGSVTTLMADPTSITFGEEVALTATVAGTDSNAGTPTGQVEFFEGLTSLGTSELTAGMAGLTTTSLPAGAAFVTARYLGDDDFAPSMSGAVEVMVAQAGTATTLTSAPTSSVFGQDVTLTATVAISGPGAGVPTGDVEFISGLTSLGMATLEDGVAMLTTGVLPVGDNPVTARYLGDGNFTASTSDAVTVTVAQAATTTTLSADPTSSVFGQSIALMAAVVVVSPGIGVPTGSVVFFNGTTSLGTVAIQNGEAILNTPSLPVGMNSVTAQYLGDGNFTASTSDAATVTVAQAATTTSLSASPNPSVVTETVALTAAVVAASPGSGVPTGTVEFFNNSTSLGTADLVNGQASLSTTSLPVGANALTVQYRGDSNFQESTSPVVTQQVNRVATSTTITASDLNPGAFQPVTLTAVVTPASGTVTPTGTVEFFADGVLLGSGDLTNDQASLTVDSLPVGVDSVTAQYLGDPNALASTSPALSITVGTDNERYVNQLYVDLLGREADEDGLSFWTQLLDAGRSRLVVVASILNSHEARVFQVQQAYETYLGREASPAEVNRTISAAYEFSTNIEGVVLSSREYFQTAGGGTVSGYLDALGTDIFGAPFDPVQEAHLAAMIREGKPLVEVVTGVLTSPPGKHTLVQSSIETILGRPADPGEVEFYLSLMDGKILLRQVQDLLYASDEFYEQAIGAAFAAIGLARSR
jgi:Bacterial Ig-like domain (group 3)/Domain of unknown function (DUF4214)